MPKSKGWVKLHRKILATRLPASQFKFFVGSIILAKSPQSKNSGLVELSVRQLADELHMSRSEVWRREKELEKMKMITLLDKGFIINNYDYYQTGKGVPPTGQEMDEKPTPTVPPEGLKVPPTGRTVPPEGQGVPSHTSESAHKKVKTIKNILKKPIFVLPDWIDKKTWEAFLEMRKKKRAVPTERAKELLVKELEKLRAEGYDPTEVLNQSIMRNYTGVFPLKEAGHGETRRNNRGRGLPKVHRTPEQIFGGKDD